jgi:hypothetical protein
VSEELEDAVMPPGGLGDTIGHIESLQSDSGLISLSRGAGADPWNHVEAAIALDIGGRHDLSLAAYRWLASNQRGDGSWFASYQSERGPACDHVDTNAVGYVATGVLAHLASTKDDAIAPELFAMVERALDYVVAHEHGRGMVPWAVGEDGSEATFGLVAASSSLVSSLRHGALLALLSGSDGTPWARAADRIAERVLEGSSWLADKGAFAMDWYYPVLCGVVSNARATDRLGEGASSFVTADGVLCRSDRRWVTSAESAEAAIAYARVGDLETARSILCTLADKRADHGGYLTGLVYPERSEFPKGETTSYSSAAVVIAADVIGGGVAADLFDARVRDTRSAGAVATSTRRLSAA